MKLDINKLEINKIAENIYNIQHDNTILKFWSPKILVPFGIYEEYNKNLLGMEFDDKNHIDHDHFRKVIKHIENLIKKKLNIEDIEFKSIIKNRAPKNDLLECRIKSIKNNVITLIEFEDKETNYLKTLYDLPKQSYIKAQIEINGLWDYRTENKEKNKVGLIVYVTKIIVLR
jgi:hypothetical protein